MDEFSPECDCPRRAGGACIPHALEQYAAEVERLEAVVERVRELHRPNAYGVCETCLDEEPLAAGDCGGATWPCATAQALGET